MRVLVVLLLSVSSALAQDARPIRILARHAVQFEKNLPAPARKLALTLAYLENSGWTPDTILSAIRESARILGQCGIALEQADVVRIEAPSRYRDFQTATAREFVRALPLDKPAIYFVAGTRQRPAFDAEAIGRGNSRTRPELADTVWVTHDTRDLGIALAHELAHVLMDSGEHSDEPGNLMREDTAPGSTRLSDGQCAKLRGTGSANGLLKPP